MEKHISEVHDKERNYLCDDCGKTFKKNHDFKKHQQKCHSISEPYSRIHCGAAFNKGLLLKEHVKATHGQKKVKLKNGKPSEVQNRPETQGVADIDESFACNHCT